MNLDQYISFQNFAKDELGFLAVSAAPAQFMDEEARRLEQWLNNGYQAKMDYMANHFDLRVDPTKLVPGSKTVFSFLYNYFTTETQEDEQAPKISMYAYGRDYHKVIKKKLKHAHEWLRENVGQTEGRAFVDSAPVLERDWARRAGLGWVGKHTLLLNQKVGSYFFLAELILDLEVETDSNMSKDHCGTCTRCIDACPTDAISPTGYVLDSSKCISYLTIELKEDIPEAYQDKLEQWMFGCDICQQVCPWNRFSTQHKEQDFKPKTELLSKDSAAWQSLTSDEFDSLFMGSPVKRAGFDKLKSNIKSVINRIPDSDEI